MASYNKVIVVGNMTRDPELRYTPGGAAVCDIGIAVNEKYTDKSGQKVEVIFPVAETLDPNVAVIDPPDVRVWVDQLSGEVELADQM